MNPARLVNGSYPTEGLVDFYHNNTWDTVCAVSWDIPEARVLCRSIGYPDAIKAHFDVAYRMNYTGPVQMDIVDCVGNESSLFDCSYYEGYCEQWEIAGAFCYPDGEKLVFIILNKL